MMLVLLLLAADDTRFTDAARLQLESRQPEAQKIYESLAEGGLRNADVEYNLGTSYGEQNELGQAILHLERAKRLRNAADIDHNLVQLRERVLEQQKGTRETALLADLAEGAGHLPLAAVGGGLLVALAVAWLAWVLRRSPSVGAIAVVLAVLCALVLGLHADRYYYTFKRPSAVVIKRAAAREGPDERFRPLLELQSGEEVRLVPQQDAPGFSAVVLPSGSVAFVPEGSCVKVEDWL